MKILICRITDDGILERSSKLIQALIQSGHEIVVATPRGTTFQQIINLGCKHIEVFIQNHGTNPVKDIGLYKQYKKIIKTEKPDLALLYTTKPNIYCGAACRRLSVPVIMNITGLGSALGNEGILQKLLIMLYKVACNGKNMKAIMFQNEGSMDFFEKYNIGDFNIYKRIPGSGVDLEKFQVQPFPTSNTVDFLFIARVMKQKGIDQYIEASKRIHKSHPEAVFHVLGECSEEYKTILDQECRSGNIVYHGKVSNIPEYLKMAQCTVQPSYYPEGISNVILEAAASGRPVITTDHTGCREGVDDKITGFIVPIKDTDALEVAISKILSMSRDDRAAMGLRGRKKMEAEFDVNIIKDVYIDLINRVK